VIGVPTAYPRNASPSYGLASFDGGATFVPQSTFMFWKDLILRGNLVPDWAVPGLPLRPDYRDCCAPYAIEQDLSLDMLRVVNVGYIISYRALTSPRLTKVSGPDVQSPMDTLRQIVGWAQPVFVYAIADPLPLAYGARDVLIVGDDDQLGAIRNFAPQRIAVLRAADAKGLEWAAWSSAGDPEVHKVMDGFDIVLPVDASGVLIVNAPPLPWWRARTEAGELLGTRPVNLGQIAIVVPAGIAYIHLRYERPSLLR